MSRYFIVFLFCFSPLIAKSGVLPPVPTKPLSEEQRKKAEESRKKAEEERAATEKRKMAIELNKERWMANNKCKRTGYISKIIEIVFPAGIPGRISGYSSQSGTSFNSDFNFSTTDKLNAKVNSVIIPIYTCGDGQVYLEEDILSKVQ